MDTFTPFILANDVEFIPVDKVTENTKSGFDHDADDVVITQLNTRTTSKVISKNLAAILQEFRSPKTIADAIYRYAETQQTDPQELAEEVFLSLVNMNRWGFIILYSPGQEGEIKGLLHSKERFRNYTIIEKCQHLEDTEVYRVRDGEENILALKLMKAGNNSDGERLFKNEVTILNQLDAVNNPKLIERGSESDLMYLVTEWCDGITCEQEALKYRNINDRSNFIQLLNLSISILQAFDHLHQQKVLHGDIHPDNILIAASGHVTIIDYGYAVFGSITESVDRGGTGFYYEPELAAALIQNTPLPAVTEKGEQYSIAVLLYYLLTGYQYLDFSFEKEKLFKQISYEKPLTLKSIDLQLPHELEWVLAKALSKAPEKRFASLEDFARELTTIRNQVFESNAFYIFNKQHPEEQLISFLVQKFGWNSSYIEQGFSLPPVSSVNYGAAGIAYMFYRISCVRQDAAMSDLADIWANRALVYKEDYDRGFYSAVLNINEKNVGKNSVYHSPTGVHLTQALISNSRNDWHTLSKSIKEFLSAAAEPSEKIDLALGKAGVLTGCSLLYSEIKTIKDYPVSDIVLAAEKIKNEIWNQLSEYPAISVTNPVDYFGIAHGWAGLLYATLFWCNTSGCSLPASFMNRLDELLSCSFQQENYIRWPLTVRDKNSWPGWCNGSAGHIFLWVLLYKHFNDDQYIGIAEKLAVQLMKETQNKNADLCCGSAGTAYSMMSLYKATNNNKYLLEAECIKQDILVNWTIQPMRNNSLYKGEPGLSVLLTEMNNPVLTRMPLFE